MSIRITPNHRLADLSIHSGMLLNKDFGWHLNSLAGDLRTDTTLVESALEIRVERLERWVRATRASIGLLVFAVVLLLVVAL